MAKKCIPGVLCVENMTLFILFVILILFVYLYYVHYVKQGLMHHHKSEYTSPNIILVQPPYPLATQADPLQDMYAPPMKNAIPVNIPSRGVAQNYSQMGILTRVNGSSDMILPLMGRQNMTGRSKYQYYTMMPSGNINTKLPISVNGKSCTSEYGCDEVNNGDIVYVDGINDTFRATIYENGLFSYIPY